MKGGSIMNILKSLFIIIATSPLLAAEPNAPDVNTVVNNANIAAYYQGDDGKAQVRMVITNKDGQTREREFIILRKDIADGGDQHYFVYFQKPADVRKMVYLVQKHTDGKDDDRWLYLPGLDLVKRIAASDKRTSFVGSDFLYEDVSGRGVEADIHTLESVTDKYYIIKNVPKEPDTVEFSYYTIAVDKNNFLPIEMTFYDKNAKLYRTIESVTVEDIEGFPTVTKSIVKDLNQGSRTEMEFSNIKYNIGVGDIFTERYLRRPPREVVR